MARIEKYVPTWATTFVVLCAVVWLTLAPHPVGRVHLQLFNGADKVIHAIMMGALSGSLLFDVWLRNRKLHRERGSGSRCLPSMKTALFIFLGVAVFSAFDEWAQGAMELGRSSDPYDFLADLIGNAFVILFYLTTKNSFRRRQ